MIDVYSKYQLLAFMQTAESYLNTWYTWGGDDPNGIDCSGLVVACLRAAGEMKSNEDLTADGLWRRYKAREVQSPHRGCLLFWLNSAGQATHTAIAINEYFCLTASGGGSRIKTHEDAIKHNAFVKIRPIDYRGPFRAVKPFNA